MLGICLQILASLVSRMYPMRVHELRTLLCACHVRGLSDLPSANSWWFCGISLGEQNLLVERALRSLHAPRA